MLRFPLSHRAALFVLMAPLMALVSRGDGTTPAKVLVKRGISLDIESSAAGSIMGENGTARTATAVGTLSHDSDLTVIEVEQTSFRQTTGREGAFATPEAAIVRFSRLPGPDDPPDWQIVSPTTGLSERQVHDCEKLANFFIPYISAATHDPISGDGIGGWRFDINRTTEKVARTERVSLKMLTVPQGAEQRTGDDCLSLWREDGQTIRFLSLMQRHGGTQTGKELSAEAMDKIRDLFFQKQPPGTDALLRKIRESTEAYLAFLGELTPYPKSQNGVPRATP